MSVSRIILGSVVIRSSAQSNRPMSWMGKQNDDKSIVGKEVKEKKSRASMVVVERAKGNNNAPKVALRTQVIPAVRVDENVLWANILDLVATLHKFTHSFQFNHTIVQMHFEKAIVDCRFFTLLAVAGSLLGSILCFVEGCFMILKSCLYYVHASSHRLDSSGVVQLVIEAIDMFLVGTAMLIFGMGLYVMFVRTQNVDTNAQLAHLNSTASSQLQMVPSWLKMHSLTQAKTRVGHAIMMILQVGILDKFKTIPLVTPLDLACFAAALLVSSISIFLLSKLSTRN
ncbi:uncharacterized protein LOC141638172 [Silene latifolia]|uniref:uncharacterized protein LOC141638172 n=1 Tax=Silene latifolia TaxID=37657 RepID=UPI003D7782ED